MTDSDDAGHCIEPAMKISMQPIKGRFIGNRDAIVLCGNKPSGVMQLYERIAMEVPGPAFDQYSQFQRGGGIDSSLGLTSEWRSCGQLDFMQPCTALEVCGMVSPLVAVATGDAKNTSLTLVQLNMENHLQKSTPIHLTHNDKLNMLPPSPISALAYCSDRRAAPSLALSTDAGEIIVFDLNTGEISARFVADAAGVNDIVFAAGQLCSVGQSPRAQLRLWDLRVPQGMGGTYTGGLGGKRTDSQRTREIRDEDAFQRYTAISSDLALQQKLIVGTSGGHVKLWDLRMDLTPTNDAMVTQSQCHGGAVTAVKKRPGQSAHDSVMSTSTDGTLKLTDFYADGLISREICSDTGAMVSLDTISDYRRGGVAGDTVLAASALGGVFLFQSNV